MNTMKHTIYKRPKDDMSDMSDNDENNDTINQPPPKFHRQQSKLQRSMFDALAAIQSLSRLVSTEEAKEEMINRCIRKVDLKYPSEIAKIINDSKKEYDTESFWNDIYEADGEWEQSEIMQLLLEAKFDEQTCDRLFTFMVNFLSGLDQDADDVHESKLTLPVDINFAIEKEKEAIEEVRKYLDIMCLEAGFSDMQKNEDLLRAFAIGQRNEFPVLQYIMDMFELSLMSHTVNAAKKAVKAEQEQKEPFSFAPNNSDDEWKGWMKQCEFTSNFNEDENGVHGLKILKLAIGSFKTRLLGNSFDMPFWNRIEDNINVYIEYILRLNAITSNIMASNKKVYPLQIEVVIVGKKHGLSKPNEDAKEQSDDEENDAIFDRLYRAGIDKQGVALKNPLPQEGMEKFLKSQGIKLAKYKISLEDKDVNKVIQDGIIKQIGKKSHQRVIVVIQRPNKNENENDVLYIFQLHKFDKIHPNYKENDIHMSWMTKRYLFPQWNDDKMGYLGAGSDFGDNSFVFSFHAHKENKVKCELFIKQHKLPFLPHHLVDIWPIYFAPKFRKVDKKYSKEYIYQNWKVPTNDQTLMTWIKYIDPKYYANLRKEHLKYQQI